MTHVEGSAVQFSAGTSDGCVLVWQVCKSSAHFLQPSKEWRSPTGAAIQAICQTSSPRCDMVASCCDASGHVFVFGPDLSVLASVKLLGKQRPISVAMAEIPWCLTAVLLAVGSADGAVRLILVGQGGSVVSSPRTFSAHSDWVKCLDFCRFGEQLLLLSGGQDSFVRIWAIGSAFEASTTSASPGESSLLHNASSVQLPPASVVCASNASVDGLPAFAVWLDSLVLGHEDWVTCVRWDALLPGRSFVSCSADKSAILWVRQSDDWQPETRVGGVGGKSVGMLGCDLGHVDGQRRLLTYGYEGVLQTWRQSLRGDSSAWTAKAMPCGHFGSISNFSVNSARGYIMSVSNDQSARVWGTRGLTILAEAGRPVCHGYPLVDAAFCSSSIDAHAFVLASAEKVARVFTCTGSFLRSLAAFPDFRGQSAALEADQMVGSNHRASSALVPELGLSSLASTSHNLSVSADQIIEERLAKEQLLKEMARGESGSSTLAHFKEPTGGAAQLSSSGCMFNAEKSSSPRQQDSISVAEGVSSPELTWQPPSQESLTDGSQWVETRKLYYHGNDLSCLASTGNLIFTACISRNESHAALAVWDTRTWQRVQSVPAHSSTINAIAVSPDGKFLATAGKDRQVALIAIDQSQDQPLSLGAIFKAHKREVTAVSWVSCTQFVSASKDGKVKLWQLSNSEQGGTELTGGRTLWSTEFPVSCMAVNMRAQGYTACIAITSTDGLLQIITLCCEQGVVECICQSSRAFSKGATALCWSDLYLFAGGEDGCIMQFDCHELLIR